MANTTRERGARARQLRVAGLIVVGLFFLVYGVYRVGKVFDVFADRYTLVTLLPSVAGLREGAMVTLAGQQIGQVDKIEFIPMHLKRNGNNLSLKLKVAERVKNQIRRDSKVQIRPQGLLGDKYLDIQPGSLSAGVLAQNDTLAAETALDMEMFLARASEAMDQAMLVITDLRDITRPLATGQGTMGQLLHDEQLYRKMVAATGEMQQVLASINSGEGTLSQLIRDPVMYRRMVSAVSRMDSLGNSILHGRGTLSQLIQNDSLYRGLAGTAAKADFAAGQFSSMLQKFNTPNGSLNRMMTDPRLFDEFLKSVIDMQTLINDVRENPKKYVPPVNVKVF
jgi:phospholipid/cholesterol/gamma-HCH transport system substrate-binding protein